ANMAPTDKHTSVQNIGVVGELFDDSIYAARNHNTAIDQFLESWLCSALPDTALEQPQEALLTNVARRKIVLWTQLHGFVEEPHDVLLTLLHSNIVGFGNVDWRAEGKLLWLSLVAIFLLGDTAVHVVGFLT